MIHPMRFFQRSSAYRIITFVFTVIVGAGIVSSVTYPPLSASSQVEETNPTQLVTEQLTIISGMPVGQQPFLAYKPYEESYTNPVKIHSFFDHALPIQNGGSMITNFLGEERGNWGNVWEQGYSYYSGHEGFDYGDRISSTSLVIIAPADGIIAGGRESSSCRILIQHDASVPSDHIADYTTLYTHLSDIGDAPLEQQTRPGRNSACGNQWCEGDTIHAGAVIGTEGDEQCGGVSKGIHLHFGVQANGLQGDSNPVVIDPFGWWSTDSDPWANSSNGHSSFWLWAAPVNPGPGNPGYWGVGIAAQTDDSDASFQRFTQITRETTWRPIVTDPSNSVEPVSGGAWWSTSIESETNTLKKTWAIWALHVPDTAQYRIQVHIPASPPGLPSPTNNAVYNVTIPTSDGSLTTWYSSSINHQANNDWLDISQANGNNIFQLTGNTIVLVQLDDVTGVNGEAVLFDAIRLKREGAPGPTVPNELRKVGFVIDNTSSMQDQGKMDVLQAMLPPWIDSLAGSGVPYLYTLEAFAENVPPIQISNDPEQIKDWIEALNADDNGLPNHDCPEESLGAIAELADETSGGNILFFTDDLPKRQIEGGIEAFLALIRSQTNLHTIVLPKTCTIGGGGDPSGWLVYRFLSSISGGTYQVLPTVAATQDALQIVLSEIETNAQLAAPLSVPFNGASEIHDNGIMRVLTSQSHDILVDDTISEVNFLLNILDGSGLTLVLTRPDGSVVSPSDPGVVYIDSGSARYYQIATPVLGVWQAQIVGTGDYLFRASADSNIQFAYLGDVQASPGVMMQLAAYVTGPVSDIAFDLHTTSGLQLGTVELFDNGILGDFTANDGIYTGLYTPTVTADIQMNLSGVTRSGNDFLRIDSRLIRSRNLSVSAPSAIDVPRGNSQVINFVVRNAGTVAETYDLEVMSGFEWVSQSPPTSVTVPAGETITVPVTILVPGNAIPNSIDIVRLIATNRDDGTIIASDSTAIIVPDHDMTPSEPTDAFLTSIGSESGATGSWWSVLFVIVLVFSIVPIAWKLWHR